MLNEKGGIESDLTVLRLAEDDYRLYVGTTAIKRDLTWIRRHLQDDEQVTITDETDAYAVIGLMGPNAPSIASKLGGDALNELKYFGHGEATIADVTVRAVRLSYVGEAGWEMTCKVEDAEKLYDALREAGAKPAGIFAQSSMRIEKQFLAYGHDLDTDLTPLEAGIDFAIDWNKDFIGKEALLERKVQPLKKCVVSIVLDNEAAVPLGNEPVYFNGNIVGKTTSASFGYRVGKPVAVALIKTDCIAAALEAGLEIDIAGEKFSGSVSKRAVFDPTGKAMRPSAS
jgi:4-methylaminobutanoate oxidase (formaldehyde-forming)